jgi:hypothetical protein
LFGNTPIVEYKLDFAQYDSLKQDFTSVGQFALFQT